MRLLSHELIVLTAPPASGKTYWIKSLHSTLNFNTLLVISPLRALADECREKWGESIVVMTPEEWIGKKKFAEIVIFDEFHLFFYWGDSFRPLMWEVFFEITEKSQITFLLTATFSAEMKGHVTRFSCHFDRIIWHDYGNQRLKYRPDFYIKAPSRKWIMREIEQEAVDGGVKMIFCKYRKEVYNMESSLKRLGFNCVTCIGGESKYMAMKLKENPSPDFIISTTVLSHGVNLPEVKTIYFTYVVGNLDFWIQMVARGGRKGESFRVYSLEKPHGIKWNGFKNAFLVFLLTFRQKYTKIGHAF